MVHIDLLSSFTDKSKSLSKKVATPNFIQEFRQSKQAISIKLFKKLFN